jgi:hypothetical protein
MKSMDQSKRTTVDPVAGMEHNPVAGVFPHIVDEAAFFDRVEFGLWGDRRLQIFPTLKIKPSIAIGGEGRSYGRSIHGMCLSTGNPFEFRYGRLKRWPNLAPFRLILRSDATPLTGSQVALVARSLLRQGYREYASRLELTFDVTEFPLSYFWKHWFSRSHLTKEFYDREGHETFYIGGPRSPWQLCVYHKTESVVRIEFKLRSVFLAAHGISHAEDLLRLRDVDVWDLVSFPEFHEPSLSSTLDASRNFLGRDLLLQSPHRWPIQTLIGFLRRRGHINPAGLIRPSPAQWQLRRMQTNMIW